MFSVPKVRFILVTFIPERLAKFLLQRQMLSPYAPCHFFSSIRLEVFLLEDFEEELFYSLAGMMPLLYW